MYHRELQNSTTPAGSSSAPGSGPTRPRNSTRSDAKARPPITTP